MDLLKIENVSKQYGDSKLVLDDISFNVERGSIYGLLGPNGAGKTTLIRIINHITAPDSGRVVFDGEPLVAAHTSQIGYLPEERGLYKKMKVGEQAVYFARLKGLSTSEATARLRQWFDKFGILSWWNRPVEELSKGMAQKVQFIITVLHRPKLLIFDEPFSGFDPVNAQLLKDEILQLKNEGATIIFSTHNMASVEEICDNITLINHGRNILTGNVDEIRHQFSDGRYSLVFNGNPADVLAATQPLVAENTLTQLPDNNWRLDLLLNAEASPRDFLRLSNESVEIRSFAQSIASMNDIFIKTVSSTNEI